MYKTKNIKAISFRDDINFLRALSVLSVLIYHINPKLLQGGWLGVDIFFFISGYLISNKIIIELNKGTFSFINFYKKRIRRIIPAILSTLVFSFPLAFLLLSPSSLYTFLNSSVASLLFYSNFFFENLDFYNSPSSKFIPLLHMWSLSVEEQFYIIFPLLLFLIYKFQKKRIFLILCAIFLGSLALNLIDLNSIKFYQIQFRIWEFSFGVLFNFFNLKVGLNKYQKISGLVLILYSLFAFPDALINVAYPKIIPLIGVFIFLLDGEEISILNKFYRLKIISLTGLISYSLYLFHQPLFAFYRVYDKNVNELNNGLILIPLVFLFLISYLNWKYIELPYINNFNRSKAKYLAILFFILLSSSLLALNKNNFFGRYSNFPNKVVLLTMKKQDVISKNGISCENRSVDETCVFGNDPNKTNVYVLGDSSLRTLSTALRLEQKNYPYNLIHFGGDGCLFIFNNKLNNESCPNKEVPEMDNFVMGIKDSIIIYGGRYPFYLTGEGFNNSFQKEDESIKIQVDLKKEVIDTIKILSKNNNKIILIYPIPEQGWNVPDQFFYKKVEWGETISYPYSIWEERALESNNFLDTLKFENIIRIYPEELFCNSFVINECVGAYKDSIFYSDDDHLSLEGAQLLAEIIIENMETYIKK